MKTYSGEVRLFNLDEFNYPKFRSRMVDLYSHSFTTGEYAQYIDNPAVESTLDELIRNGKGIMAFVYDRLVGLLLAVPLSSDPDFPGYRIPSIKVNHTVYIAEVMIHSEFRGRGIATKMVWEELKQDTHSYTDAVIRVWDKNEPAISLYKKMGFKQIASILQEKLTTSREMFLMSKIYLHKKLTNDV